MYYVYVLQSILRAQLYVGSTDDLRRRYREHQQGKVESTKGMRPLKLIFYEAFAAKEDAKRREQYFKTTKGKRTLRLLLKRSLSLGP